MERFQTRVMLSALVALALSSVLGASGAIAQTTTPPKGAKPAVAAAPTAAPGTTPKPEDAQPASSWATTCSNQVNNQFTCEMTQNIVEQRTRNQIALISIKSVVDGPANAMLIRIFHGVYLPAGVAVKIDAAAPQPLAFQKSDTFGSYAVLPLNDKLVAELKKAKELRLVVQINQGEEFQIPASTNGFAAGYDRLVAMR